MSELKPCPFCGGEAEFLVYEYSVNSGTVECKSCATTSNLITDRESAIKAWNTRANEQEMKDE